MTDIDKLEALAKAAPGGQWEVWTSNSWRRVLANQFGRTVRVIEPVVQRHDNHPDLMFGDGVREYLEGVTPDTILALIAEVRALRADRDHWKANHDNQVTRARFLIERGDIPVERVRTWGLMGALLQLEDAIRHDREMFEGTSDEDNPMGVLVRQALEKIDAARGAQ